MRNIFKISLLLLLQPITRLMSFFNISKHAIVLMYHSVESSGWKYSVSPEMFEKQMMYLKNNYNVIPLNDIVSFVCNGTKIPNLAVAITIDDGYKDTYETVFPILKKYRLPATVFLTSDLREQPKLGSFERLSEKQIQEMHDSGLVSFEVHGREHKNLAKLDVKSEEFKSEVIGCQKDIERMTGYTSRMIAYAAGNRSEEVQQKLKEAGFVAGFGITEGIVKRGDDPLKLRRVQIDNTMPFLLFKLRLTKAIQFYNRIITSLKV